MNRLSPVHRTSANRELATTFNPRPSITRPGYRKVKKRSLAVNIAVYFSAIGVIGWFVLTDGRMTGSPGKAAAAEVQSEAPVDETARAPQPAPTYALDDVDGRAPSQAGGDDFWGAPEHDYTVASWSPQSRDHY